MNIPLYATCDSVARTFSDPWSARNDEHAVRTFKQILSKTDPILAESLQLYLVGDYDYETGRIASREPLFISDKHNVSVPLNREI